MKHAIEVENLGKQYRITQHKEGTLRGTLRNFSPISRSKKKAFWALRDIHFHVGEGEVLGIIGPNGSGKSTLLKLISKITVPTTGRIRIKGRVNTLLEVGTGFHPELTGHENIFLNGSILGMSRQEIRSKYDEIVSFAEVEKFLDTPVKHYSSGMYVRLAFSVAAHLNPDILIVDEVLSVGDADFRKKSLLKMERDIRQGRTVLFVSHQMETIERLCDRVMFLREGTLQHIGRAAEVTELYLNSVYEQQTDAFSEPEFRKGSGQYRFKSLVLLDKNDQVTSIMNAGDKATFRVEVKGRGKDIDGANIHLLIKSNAEQVVLACVSRMQIDPHQRFNTTTVFECRFERLPLNAGSYHVELVGYDNHGVADQVSGAFDFKVQPGLFYTSGNLPMHTFHVLSDYQWKIR